MKGLSNDKKRKIKDWFSLQGVRLTSFVKEHKYASTVIVTLLFAGVIGFIVYATNNEDINVSNVSVAQSGTGEHNEQTYSFSTMTYTLNYQLTSKKDEDIENASIEIIAEITDDVDVQWNRTTNSHYEEVNGAENKRKLIIEQSVSNVPAVKDQTASIPYGTITLTLNIGNVKQGNIHYNFSINGQAVSDITTVNNTKTKDLKLKVLGGKPYTNDNNTKRNVPFAIVAGIDEELYNEINNSETGLKGYYFNNSLSDITLNATEIKNNSNGNPTEINILEDNTYYGNYLNKGNKANFSEKYDNVLTSNNSANNGTGVYEHKTNTTVECNDITINALQSVGFDKVILNPEYEYNDPIGGYITKIVKDGSTEDIKTSILSVNSTDNSGKLKFSDTGTYKVTYEYKETKNNISITYERTFEVVFRSAGGIQDDEYYYNYKDSSMMDKINACLNEGEEYCQVFTASDTLDGANGLTQGERITDASKVDSNTNYIINHCNNDATCTQFRYKLYYINKTIDLIKSFSITNENNACVAKYNESLVEGIPSVSSTPRYVYKKDGLTIAYSLPQSTTTSSNLFNISNMKVNIATKNENGKIVIDNSLLDIKASMTEANAQVKLIPMASFYVTAEASKVTGEISNKITLSLNHSSSSDSDVVYNYDPQNNPNSKIDAKLNISDENGETLYSKTSTSTEVTDLNKTMAYGESVKLDYTITYDAENESVKQNEEFIIYLNEGLNKNYIFKDDNSSELGENIQLQYYSLDEAVLSKEEAIDKPIKYIKGTIVSLSGNVSLTYSVNTEIGNTSVTEQMQTKFVYKDLSNVSKELTGYIKSTPFKARTDIYVIDSKGYPVNEDVTIQAQDTNMSTLSIYPIVESKSYAYNKVNSSLSGKVNVTVKVELPSKVTYIQNIDYINPSSKEQTGDGKTILTYNFYNKNINEIIDSITFNIVYDVTIEDNEQLIFKSTIDASDAIYPNISDLSSVDERTSIRKITYLSGENVIARLTATPTSIMKNDEFKINADLYNGTNVFKKGSLVINLPQTGYQGTYKISDLSNADCTTDIITGENINWSECDNYKSTDYTGVTAIKLEYKLETKTNQSNSFTVKTNSNKPGDTYNFDAVIYQSEEDTVGTKISSVKVDVTSLRISGTVWDDFDEDGIMDDGETKIKDIKLNLYNASNNEFIDYRTSDKNGNYSFEELDYGSYYVTADLGDNYNLSESVPGLTNKAVINSFTNQENVIRTENIVADGTILNLANYNLGLVSKKIYKVDLDKTITKVEITNALGITSTKDMGNTKLGKLDIRDMNNTKIKVVYNIEVVNKGSYPGYIYRIKDYIPAGMTFNPEYAENKGWYQSSDEYIEYQDLYNTNTLLEPGVKHNISLALDISTKEAGSFLNYAIIEEDDLKILGGMENE